MTDKGHAKYMKAFKRGEADANADNGYEIAHESSNLEKQGYGDGFMVAMDKLDPRG